jgi:DNA polymerase-4
MYRALALCPEAVILPARHQVYRQYSRQVMEILHQTSPLMEQISIDEAYLDLTEHVGTWDEAAEIAQGLQRRVREEIGLSASLGVATNKLVAKVAADHDKPGGLTVVQPGEEAAFLAPLPVRVLWGVGPVTAQKLEAMGIKTVGDLARLPEEELRARFGKHGIDMARRAQGIDERPVVTEHERKSVSQERTFAHDLRDPRALRRELKGLSQGTARRLQRAGMEAGTVAIKLRYADFTTLSRQMQLAVPTDDEEVIYRAALTLLRRAWERGRPVRLLGVAGRDLSPPAGQLPLL